MRRYSLNETYFDQLTPESAYVLGFIMADGCHYTPAYKLQIVLHQQDLEVLEYIKQELEFSGPIKVIHPSKRSFKPQNLQRGLHVKSKIMSASLLKAGVPPRKTLNLQWPSISPFLVPHLIRGYFDGDGCIVLGKKNRQMTFKIQSSRLFCEGFREFLAIEMGMRSSVRHHRGIYELSIGGNKRVHRIMEWLYAGDGFRLSRKYQKYRRFLQEIGYV